MSNVEVYLKEAKSRAFIDIRLKFKDRDIVIESFTQPNRNLANGVLEAFTAVAQDMSVVFRGSAYELKFKDAPDETIYVDNVSSNPEILNRAVESALKRKSGLTPA